MIELYSFSVCIALGIFGRILFMGASALARRSDLIPVTVALDALTVCVIGGAFTLYVVLARAVLAPYMFAALFGGYLITYHITKKRPK